MQRPYVPVPFPGPAHRGLVAGITPPTDSQGRPLDLLRPQEALEATREAFDTPGWPAYWVGQVHGRDVVRIEGAEPPGPAGTADALMTDVPGALLLTRHADCPPVLLWDPARRAVGLAHSGRKGTFLDISGALVSAMREAYGSEPGVMLASIGPGIRSRCYEVGPEVVREARELGLGRFVEDRDAGSYLDLHGIIAGRLREAGVGQVCGERDAECTNCGPTGMHSHRRDGTRMRFAAVAGIAP